MARPTPASAARRLPPATAHHFLWLLVVLSPGTVLADQRFERLTGSIHQLLQEERLPSIVAGVAKEGRIIWSAGFGWADRERQIPATPQTPYSVASVSKPFTATAVMKLVDSGRLLLDRPANDYLGEARITGRSAEKSTVRRLLSHMAGLPPFFRPVFGGDADPIEETVARHAILSGPPGRRHVYSNLGYGVLEHIIERVSGMGYHDFMTREIFQPLRLEDTAVARAPIVTAAARYDDRGGLLPFYDVGHRAASAVFASAHDLLRFGMFHVEGRVDDTAFVLTRRSTDAMQRIETPESPARGYGLGWRIEEFASDFRVVGHTGGMPGVTAVLNLYPVQRVVIVVLANKRSDAVIRVERKIAAAVVPHYRLRVRTTRP